MLRLQLTKANVTYAIKFSAFTAVAYASFVVVIPALVIVINAIAIKILLVQWLEQHSSKVHILVRIRKRITSLFFLFIEILEA